MVLGHPYTSSNKPIVKAISSKNSLKFLFMRIYVIESKYETLKTNWKRVKHVNIIESKQISCTSMFYISIAKEETQNIQPEC